VILFCRSVNVACCSLDILSDKCTFFFFCDFDSLFPFFDLQAFIHYALSSVRGYPSCVSHRMVLLYAYWVYLVLKLVVLPVISTLWYRYVSVRAIESGSISKNQQCLSYWVLFSLINILEWLLAKLIEW
jgi:hypothetical protein